MSTNILDPPGEMSFPSPVEDESKKEGWFRSIWGALKIWKWSKKDIAVAKVSNDLTDLKWIALLWTDQGQQVAIGIVAAFKAFSAQALLLAKQSMVFLKVFIAAAIAGFEISA